MMFLDSFAMVHGCQKPPVPNVDLFLPNPADFFFFAIFLRWMFIECAGDFFFYTKSLYDFFYAYGGVGFQSVKQALQRQADQVTRIQAGASGAGWHLIPTGRLGTPPCAAPSSLPRDDLGQSHCAPR